MLSYIEYLNVPAKAAIVIAGLFLVMQAVGELLEFKGKVVPEFLKIRKYFVRKKQERAMLSEIPSTLSAVKKTLDEINKHYSDDNIQMRNQWMRSVNDQLEQNDSCIKALAEKLDKNNEDTLALLIDSKRNTIINFASLVIDETKPVTREQFNRIFKLYTEYEAMITANGLTNGEVDIAYRIIRESYENHMRNHSFVEDIRGYGCN